MKKTTILFVILTLSVGMWAQGNAVLNTLPTPASNQIVYRSATHEKITPHHTDVFGEAIYNDDDNVYYTEADYGIITFDGNVTTIGDYAFSACANIGR